MKMMEVIITPKEQNALDQTSIRHVKIKEKKPL